MLINPETERGWERRGDTALLKYFYILLVKEVKQ